jgi:hypothetical protein
MPVTASPYERMNSKSSELTSDFRLSECSGPGSSASSCVFTAGLRTRLASR